LIIIIIIQYEKIVVNNPTKVAYTIWPTMLLLKLIIEKDAGNMSVSKHIQTVLNGTVSSIKTILPMQINVSAPSVSAEPFVQQEMGVLIGIVGDLKGRIIIDGSSEIFGNIGAAMFGMPLEGEMLESFTGEFGNMIAGNLCTIVGQEGLELDITPPTVMVGNTKLYGFQKIFRLPTSIEGIGNLTLLLTMDEE
jgi:chemotaxis protein CheX